MSDSPQFAFPMLGGRDLYLGRVAGPGLGNMLFPWARSVLTAERLRLTPLTPTWPQLKLGPLLRRELDSRAYATHFRARNGEVGGIRRLRLLMQSHHFDEDGRRLRRGPSPNTSILVFRGLKDYFAPLRGQSETLLRALSESTQNHLRPAPASRPLISIHARCGDFLHLPNDELPDEGLPPLYRLPIALLSETVEDILEIGGDRFDIRVYSDGSDSELGPLLNIPGVSRSKGSSAITELLEMSRSRLVVGTPHSTFSMWGAFLAACPLIGFRESGGRDYGFRPATRTLDREKRRKITGHLLG